MLATIVRFRTEKEAADYLAILLRWVEENPPAWPVRVGEAKFLEAVTNPYTVVFFYPEQHHQAFEAWYGRWVSTSRLNPFQAFGGFPKMMRANDLFYKYELARYLSATPWSDVRRPAPPEPESLPPPSLYKTAQLISVIITREMVEALDIAAAAAMFEKIFKFSGDSSRNKIRLIISGYTSLAGRIYEIDAVRIYMQTLFDELPGLFYWLDINHSLKLLLYMLYRPRQVGPGKVYLESSDIAAFVLRGQRKLVAFCKTYGLSPEPSLRAIAARFHLDLLGGDPSTRENLLRLMS